MKYFFTVAVILIICSSSLSQVIDRTLSIKGGLNLSTITGKNTENFKNNKGILFGLSKSVWPMNSRFNSQVELLFSMKGANLTYNNEFDEKVEVFYDLYYIEFPFMIKYKMRNGNTENSDTNIFLNCGCEVGFNILAETDEGNDKVTNISSSIYNQEFGIVAGASYESRFNNSKKYSVEFRYNRSLISILENDEVDNFNEVFSIILGFGLIDF